MASTRWSTAISTEGDDEAGQGTGHCPATRHVFRVRDELPPRPSAREYRRDGRGYRKRSARTQRTTQSDSPRLNDRRRQQNKSREKRYTQGYATFEIQQDGADCDDRCRPCGRHDAGSEGSAGASEGGPNHSMTNTNCVVMNRHSSQHIMLNCHIIEVQVMLVACLRAKIGALSSMS